VTPPLLEETVPPVLQGATACAGLTVNLSLKVGEDGRVSSCRVLSPTDAACAKAAREAGLRYRFKPALDAQGQPVEAVVAIAIILGEAP
jgi:TonB family protein